MQSTPQSPLTTSEWLAEHLNHPGVRVVDATWRPMSSPRDPRVDFAQARIPGATLLDHPRLSQQGSEFCDTRPDAAAFAAHVSALGIGNDDRVVVYSQKGTTGGASRAWWLFRSFGHTNVVVLDGGLPAWRAAGNPVDEAPPQTVERADFTAKDIPQLVVDLPTMQNDTERTARQIVDARPPRFFAGQDIYDSGNAAGPTVQPGRIPGSVNLPFPTIVDPQTMRMQSPAALRAALAELGLDANRPVVTTCSLGVGACTAALALAVAGVSQVAVFDGAWEMWGSHPHTPKTVDNP